MKKLLWMFLLCISMTPTFNSNACGRRTDVSGLASIMVAGINDPPNPVFGSGTSGSIKATAVAPNGDIYYTGDFQVGYRFDGTSTGIIQTLTGLNGLMRVDHVTGALFPVSTPVLLPGTFPSGAQFINGFLYANLNNTFMRQNLDGSWTNVLPKKVDAIMPSNDPNIFAIVYIENQNDPVGVRLWNVQTNVLTPMGNSNRPDYNSGYTVNQSQVGDTIVFLFHNMGSTFPLIWIKGQTQLLQFDNTFGTPNIGIKNPIYGYGAGPGNEFDGIGDVFFLPNGKIYAVGTDPVIDSTSIITWNPSTQSWDLIVKLNFSALDMSDQMWFDPVKNEIHLYSFKGWLDTETGFFTQADENQSWQMPTSSIRSNSNLYFIHYPSNWMMQQVDTTKDLAPSITTPSGIVSIVGEQYLTFTGTIAHDGDLATMYDCCGNILHTLSIDATNCSNFVFNHLVPLGTNVYYFSLTDPSGNESTKTQITVVASWPTGIPDIDKDFATVSTLSKTIFIKGDVSKIEVYDLNAKVIFSSRVNSNEFTQSLDNIASGMYILKATNSKGEIMTKKLLLN